MTTLVEQTVVKASSPGLKIQERQQEKQPADASLGCGVEVFITTPAFSLVGVIQAIKPHSLSILVRQALAKGSVVSVEFGAVSCAGVIVYCRPNGTRYEACIVLPKSDRRELRAEDRFPVTQEVGISADSLEYQVDAVITDLSAHGMGLGISLPLETGEIVTVESATDEAFGIVRHCRRLDDGRFHAGVEVFHMMPKEVREY